MKKIHLSEIREAIRKKLLQEEYEYDTALSVDSELSDDVHVSDFQIGDSVYYIDKSNGKEIKGAIYDFLGSQAKIKEYGTNEIHFAPIYWLKPYDVEMDEPYEKQYKVQYNDV